MTYSNQSFSLHQRTLYFIFTLSLFLTGCNFNEDDTESSGVGYFQLYNASKNAPAIFMTVDQIDNDDFTETTFSGVNYSYSSGYKEYENDNYDIELAWKDGDDLQVFHEQNLNLDEDVLKFIVVADDFVEAKILTFDIPLIDEDEKQDDADDDLFNIRFLNMYQSNDGIDIYRSKSDETINQAILIGQLQYEQLSENIKLDQDDYIYYLKIVGNDEIIYQSDEISYSNSTQHLMIVRENQGSGSSPLTIDRVTTSAYEFPDKDSEAKFRVYNGIATHELLEGYQDQFDLYVNGIDDSAEISALQKGQFSNEIISNFGDYTLSLTLPDSQQTLMQNQLLTLNVNTDKSVFFYLKEQEMDEDGDGNYDEDGDGYVDAWEVTVDSLVVENSHSQNIYQSKINIINLIDDYDSLNVYFVKSNETIDTTDGIKNVRSASTSSITLDNNSYKIYVVGVENNNNFILANFDLTLDELSQDLFLILEENSATSTGYQTSLTNQTADSE